MANPLDHETQRKIILKLIHRPQASFNELWSKEGESNNFAYHLNKLEEQGFVQKVDVKYQLTEEGRRLSAFIEGDTGGRAEFPTLTVLIIVKRNGKYLCQKRLKEPFFGYWSFVSGKINFGMNLFECATRDLEEETGLIAREWRFMGMELVKTYDNGNLLFHHYLMIVETENPAGELKERTHKAEHAWMTLDEYHKGNTFPGAWCSEHVIGSARPVIVEGERYMENGRFTGAKLLSVREC